MFGIYSRLLHSQAGRMNPTRTAGMLKRPAAQPDTCPQPMCVASTIMPERTPYNNK